MFGMELRHLRYFVAIAEEGSLTVAANRRLHTAQPSLSRQMRDLEGEIGVALFKRSARGSELTAAGQAFLHHARLALAQVEAGASAARQAAHPERRALALGFLTGCEPEWLPAIMHVLRDELPHLEFSILSKHSPQLAQALSAGQLDAAFMRREENHPDLAYEQLISEPLIAVLPCNHRLASRLTIRAADLAGEKFIGMADQAPVLRRLTDDYIAQSGIELTTAHRVEYLSMAVSLVASTHGVALLPAYGRNFLTRSVTTRPLAGDAPSIDLVLGHHAANTSPVLKLFMSRVPALLEAVVGTSPGGGNREEAPQRDNPQDD